LVFRDSFLVSDQFLDFLDCVSSFSLKCDSFTSESSYEDLFTSSHSQNKVNGGFFLNVVVRESSLSVELLSSENKSLFSSGNSFSFLDLLVNRLNRISVFNFESHSLSSQSSNEDLVTSSESKNHVDSGSLLDVVVRKSSFLLEFLASENQSLFMSWDSFLFLHLLLKSSYSISVYYVNCVSLACEGLYEYLLCHLLLFLLYSFLLFSLKYKVNQPNF